MRRCKPFDAYPLPESLQARLAGLVHRRASQTILLEGAGRELRDEVAESLAASFLCRASAVGACGQCPSCRYMESGTHPDYMKLPEDPESKRIPVEDVRRVMADAMMAPQVGRDKVYVIDGDKLNEQGQNALLKTLEEPPAAVYFVVTVQSEEDLLPTLRSRATLLTLVETGDGDATGETEDPEAREAAEAEFRQVRDLVLAIPGHGHGTLLTRDFDALGDWKDTPERFHGVAARVIRDLMVLREGVAEAVFVPEATEAYRAFLAKYQPSSERLAAQQRHLDEWLQRLQGNANWEMTSCALLLAWRKEYTYGGPGRS